MAQAELPPLPAPWLVISDLDGTILDHWSYSPAAMMEVLHELESRRVPVVFNTSKTAAELLPLRLKLHNHHPFIVENGSAIYLPKDYFSHPVDDAEADNGYTRIVLGRSREQLQHWLSTAANRLHARFVTFADLSIPEVAELTAMDEAEAAHARKREFSEVISWRDNTEARLELCRAAEEAGFIMLQGGRFLHLLGDCDKGLASRRLMEEYHKHYGHRPSLIVCGDGENDVAMLRIADLALIVRSPSHDLPVLDDAVGKVMISEEAGPQGLAQLFQEIFSHAGDEAADRHFNT